MEALFRNLVAGNSRGLGPTLARAALTALSLPYRAGVAVRNYLYDARVLPSVRAAVPVVSVGNITLGGTGKTPLVEYVCRWFQSCQKHPVILSRGYRSAGARNDEARLLALNLPDVPHLQ